MKAIQHKQIENSLVDSRQARVVVGVLGLLIKMVGACSSLGIVLQQARSEIVSLVNSQEQGNRPRSAA